MFHDIQKFQKCRSNFILYGNLTRLNIQNNEIRVSVYTLYQATTITIEKL